MQLMLPIVMGVAAAIATPLAVSAQTDVLAQRYDVFIQHDKLNVFQKTVKELNTSEGRIVLGAAATYLGLDPNSTNAAVAGSAHMVVPNGPEEFRGIIKSPAGYTICLAKPANPNMGAGEQGIETHGDTTFNATLIRVIPGKNNDDGLAWYIVVPFKAGTDTRVTGSFDVVWVKASPGWQQRWPGCRPSGEHPWLARNNHTQLNVKCSVPQYCE